MAPLSGTTKMDFLFANPGYNFKVLCNRCAAFALDTSGMVWPQDNSAVSLNPQNVTVFISITMDNISSHSYHSFTMRTSRWEWIIFYFWIDWVFASFAVTLITNMTHGMATLHCLFMVYLWLLFVMYLMCLNINFLALRFSSHISFSPCFSL